MSESYYVSNGDWITRWHNIENLYPHCVSLPPESKAANLYNKIYEYYEPQSEPQADVKEREEVLVG